MEPWPTLNSLRQEIYLPDNELNIFFYEAGSKDHPTMILIHGLGDEADTWRHVILPLSKNFHIIALDLPGFGRSGKSGVAYSLAFFLESITKMMDALRINKVIFMGSSLGGIIAHEMAIRHSSHVTGLILIGGALIQKKKMGDLGLLLMQIPGLGEWFYTRLRKNPQAAYDSLRSVYHELDLMPIEDKDFLFERVNQRVWSDNQRQAYFSTLRETAKWIKKEQKNFSQNLDKIHTPTLLIRGEFDNLFSQENALDLISNQSKVDYFSIDDAGHLPHQEKPDLFLSKVIPWLNHHFK
jgi:pimeloyl-ACP methyl ester carboxylesterase